MIKNYDEKLWNYNQKREELFRLTYGIYHPGRPYISRDSRMYLFESRSEAIEFLESRQKTHAEMGYKTMTAILDYPSGKVEYLS